MHHYTWKGIDLSGKTKQGTLVADCPAHLKEQLLHAGIALLSYSNSRPTADNFIRSRLVKTNTQSALINFFEYLCHLLESGIPLLKSLELVAAQNKNQSLSPILENITQQVRKGESFSSALKKYPGTFSPLIIQLVTSGESTGKLASALTYLNTHLKEETTFRKTVLEAALFPLFTMAFAIIIMVGILLFIIPQFESFFSSMNKTLPPLTTAILGLSTWLRSWRGLAVIIFSIFFCIILKFALPKNSTQKIINNIPLMGNIIITANLIHVLHMLSLFLKSGIPLKTALETIRSSVKNHYFNQKIQHITQAIIAGQSLTNQLPRLAPAEEVELLTTFVSLGEQTGKLDAMLDKAAIIFEDQLKKRIARFTLFFQPTLLIIIGLIIAILMAAVYLPLFNLAYSVS